MSTTNRTARFHPQIVGLLPEPPEGCVWHRFHGLPVPIPAASTDEQRDPLTGLTESQEHTLRIYRREHDLTIPSRARNAQQVRSKS